MSAPEVSTTVPLMLPVVLNWPKAEGRNAPTHSEQTRNRALRRTVVNAAYVSFLCFTKPPSKMQFRCSTDPGYSHDLPEGLRQAVHSTIARHQPRTGELASVAGKDVKVSIIVARRSLASNNNRLQSAV